MSKCCIIKSNSPELRQRLEQSGISVCICSSFKDADWLCCWESNMAYEEDFTKETNPILCESEDEFIDMFKEADWLCCWESNTAYDVHGVYPDGIYDLSKEAYQEDFIKETNPIICESEDEFINMCKQFRRK